ncbi:MAG: hypothetical protein AB1599_08430 [Planctomycetota bacterium]
MNEKIFKPKLLKVLFLLFGILVIYGGFISFLIYQVKEMLQHHSFEHINSIVIETGFLLAGIALMIYFMPRSLRKCIITDENIQSGGKSLFWNDITKAVFYSARNNKNGRLDLEIGNEVKMKIDSFMLGPKRVVEEVQKHLPHGKILLDAGWIERKVLGFEDGKWTRLSQLWEKDEKSQPNKTRPNERGG